jgi:flagellar biosynthetic protein FliQ
MTLSFVPKLVLVMFTFGAVSSYMLTLMADYFRYIFDQIASIS